MDGQEIKLGLSADDLTGFLKNNKSLIKLLELVLLFGKCSGLVIKTMISRKYCYLETLSPRPPTLIILLLKTFKFIPIGCISTFFSDRRTPEGLASCVEELWI